MPTRGVAREGWDVDGLMMRCSVVVVFSYGGYQQSSASGTSREGEGGARVRLGSSKPEYDQHRALVLVNLGVGPSQREG